jgi:putative acyl-CoA dehydrogenase
MPTHSVFNIVEPLSNYNLYTSDMVLQAAMQREGGGEWTAQATALGEKLGSEEVIQWGFTADQNPPVLKTHDRAGRRSDSVDYHPAYHSLMDLSVSNGLHSLPWEGKGKGAHVARAAMFFLVAQNELGHGCPISMTCSVVPVLQRNPTIHQEWAPRITRHYDPRLLPASQKRGVIFGMAMTEKQGGSDVRANTTKAEHHGDHYLLTGHKFFCSAPMSDAFCVLAQAPGGLSCFLVPRFLPDGTKNKLYFQRLKNKLGNKANASSEVEYDQTSAFLIGEEGRGVPTIIDMVNHTRLDCVIGAAALMRSALVQAVHHARSRSAFGKSLLQQPLMQNVLTDLSLEVEAATALAMRLARSFEGQTEAEQALKRMATPLAKYWLCKRVTPQVVEALECLGGGGYVEESVLPRLFRESPLYSIWEGSGNVICLDVLRALMKNPVSFDAVLSEIALGFGVDSRLNVHIEGIKDLAVRVGKLSAESLEWEARRLVETLALGLQGSLLVRNSPEAVWSAWCRARLGEGGRTFGTLPSGVESRVILDRAFGNHPDNP